MNFRHLLKAAPAAVCVSVSAVPAAAQEGFWSYTVAPYFWASSLSGEMRTLSGAPPVDIDASFSDIWENLDFAFMVVGNANNGQWGITGDLQYYDLSADGQVPGAPLATVSLGSKVTAGTVTGEYLLTKTFTAEIWGGVGARFWDVEGSVGATITGAGGPAVIESNDWVDPIVGVRGRYDTGSRGFLTGWAYAGGFGAGSDMMYDLFGGYGFTFTDSVAAVAGYRWMSVDREDGTFIYDVEQQGLLLGLRLSF
ncbi:MAG: hypothetical protein AAGF74_16150 [Pseudomonadota bacterium]